MFLSCTYVRLLVHDNIKKTLASILADSIGTFYYCKYIRTTVPVPRPIFNNRIYQYAVLLLNSVYNRIYQYAVLLSNSVDVPTNTK